MLFLIRPLQRNGGTDDSFMYLQYHVASCFCICWSIMPEQRGPQKLALRLKIVLSLKNIHMPLFYDKGSGGYLAIKHECAFSVTTFFPFMYFLFLFFVIGRNAGPR